MDGWWTGGRLLPGQQDHAKAEIPRKSTREREVDDETRLLVAVSAVSLTVGWPDYTWDQLAEVLLHPEDFDRDDNFGGTDASGRAHPWGIVILSVPALNRSFDEASDGYHVGFHEFAHLLDLLHSRFDGIPSGLSDDSIRRWMKIIQAEEDRLRRVIPYLIRMLYRTRLSSLRRQWKLFFRRLLRFAGQHGELYEFLSSYFCQDPASWSHPARP